MTPSPEALARAEGLYRQLRLAPYDSKAIKILAVALTEQAQATERATWEAAAAMAATIRVVRNGTTTNTREIWGNEMASELERLYLARSRAHA